VALTTKQGVDMTNNQGRLDNISMEDLITLFDMLDTIINTQETVAAGTRSVQTAVELMVQAIIRKLS